MKQENTNFFDARTIVSIILMTAIFVGWQSYMQRKYPQSYRKKEAVVAPKRDSLGAATGAPVASESEIAKSSGGKGAEVSAPSQEKLVEYKSQNIQFAISSRGMGLKDYKVLSYKDRQGNTVALGLEPSDPVALPLETRLLGHSEPLTFAIERVNDNMFVGRAQVGGLKITKTMEIIPDKYLLQFRVSATGQEAGFVGLSTLLIQEAESHKKETFLLPQLEKQEFFIEAADGKDRTPFKKEDFDKAWTKVKVASIGSQYFTQALLDQSPVLPEAKGQLTRSKDAAEILMNYPVLTPGAEFVLDYKAYLGPKSFGLLRKIDPSLASVVDFGWFSWIAQRIFEVMGWFHGLVGNWGLAIICLTLLVRLFVLPLNIYSYRSMRAMQAVQPQVQLLRERFKDDQQKQQAEIMHLFREHKVNPLGGCLPVLLQFPIFIALYQVVGHSIELYQAPLGLWIHDLSLKDPYYILPVFMGLTMFIQQKITPNATMDPAQAKVLMLMPLLFTGFMVSLPSGLTLYMLVGAVFSVAQQTYFMRSKKNPSVGVS